uniref:Secreted protein n=1 Tax=Peronospora matthiolae TaxID=2874970 RepID=A0AAV1TPU5_9STRA
MCCALCFFVEYTHLAVVSLLYEAFTSVRLNNIGGESRGERWEFHDGRVPSDRGFPFSVSNPVQRFEPSFQYIRKTTMP